MASTTTPPSYQFDYENWLRLISTDQIDIDIEKFTEFVQSVRDNGLPILIGASSVAAFVGISKSQLFSVLGAKHKFYREFFIPKRSGGQREISMPYPFLYYIQRNILTGILNPFSVVKLHDAVHGFVPGRSIVTNAREHICNANKSLLKLDISDFFGSVSQSYVKNIYSAAGYSDRVAMWLARLCTNKSKLPQGAPTSPAIANLTFINFDNEIDAICKQNGLIYTRYADDISISGDVSLCFVSEVQEILAGSSFSLNSKKSKIYKSGFSITGISVTGDGLRLPQKVKRGCLQELYFIQKYGLFSAMRKQGEGMHVYPESVYGKLRHWLNVEGLSPQLEDAFHIYWPALRHLN